MSSINIEVIDVTIEKQGQYEKMAVSHKIQLGANWKTDGKALVSFATPVPVWEAFKFAKKGEQFVVHREKDAKNFWQWKEVERVGEGGEMVAATSAPTEAKAAVPASNFAARDDLKQKFIIRQSSLKAAVDFNPGSSVEEVLAVAEQFVEFILKGE